MIFLYEHNCACDAVFWLTHKHYGYSNECGHKLFCPGCTRDTTFGPTERRVIQWVEDTA